MQTDSKTLYRSNLKGFPLSNSGKVRDIYDIDDQHLLIVTSDRLSAFDVILPDPIPGKGRVLTEVSNFWFSRCRDIIPNHLSDLAIEDVIKKEIDLEALKGRSIVVRKLKPLPIEAVIPQYPCSESSLLAICWNHWTGLRSLMPSPASAEQEEGLRTM